MPLHLTGDPEADELLGTDPLALLVGMVLDQQIPLERAFRAPAELAERLGRPLDAPHLAAMDPEELAAVFGQKPALHRFPTSMAGRVQKVCAVIGDRFAGDASGLWTTAADGAQFLANVRDLPGFGEQKARIFVALVGKQLGAAPPGWVEASSPYGDPGTFQSVADIDSPEALAKVRQYKQDAKARAKAGTAPGS